MSQRRSITRSESGRCGQTVGRCTSACLMLTLTRSDITPEVPTLLRRKHRYAPAMKMRFLLPLAAAIAFPLIAADVPTPPAVSRAVRTISGDAIAAHDKFLASDLLEGRGPGTRGDQIAQEYIAAQFEALGLQP